MEVEGQYLKEALEIILQNPHSDSDNSSFDQILRAIFHQPTPHHVEITFDTYASTKAHNSTLLETSKSLRRKNEDPTYVLIHALKQLDEPHLAGINGFRFSIMTPSAIAAAASALMRARNAGKMSMGGKGGEAFRGSVGRAALAIAMTSATSAATTGAADGVHGADPRIVDSVRERLRAIFQSHGAVHLQCPLLRPRFTRGQQGIVETPIGGPAELMNGRGTVLVLPEDLTVSFARQCARGGSATACFKRYDIDKVYLNGIAGGHPRESLEASFDIVDEDNKNNGEYLEGETILVLCQSIGTIFSSGEVEMISC